LRKYIDHLEKVFKNFFSIWQCWVQVQGHSLRNMK
jgi:hypothetical protein